MNNAYVIFLEPELVILDEPTVGLDPLLREKYNSPIFNKCIPYFCFIIIRTLILNKTKYLYYTWPK